MGRFKGHIEQIKEEFYQPAGYKGDMDLEEKLKE